MKRQFVGIAFCSGVLLALTAVRLGVSWSGAIAAVLTVLVLWQAMEQSRSCGQKLVQMLTLMYVGVSFLNTLAEAVLFQVMTASHAATALAGGALTAITIIALMVLIGGRWTPAQRYPGASPVLKTGLPWRIPVIALCYCALYIAAGIAVHPFIREFYAGKRLPTLPELLAVQFLRSTLYVLLVLPWLQAGKGSRWRLTVSLAVIFSVLGGLAPLLLAAAYMPPAIRWAHAAEVCASNFLFGLAAGYLLLARSKREADGIVAGTCEMSRNIGM